MPNLDHIMPNPHVVPIFWGHDYIANPVITHELKKMISDLITGSFMNGLAQYGIVRGHMLDPIIIDDHNPPATVTDTDSNNQFLDEITKKLIGWINAGIVPAPPSPSDINQFYLIIPPTETTLLKFNGANDPIGNGIQGWHNEGNTNPAGPPTYYWATIKTSDVGPITSIRSFVNNCAPKISHEIVEQLVDRNGSFEEIGDPCNSPFSYRGWTVEQYWSEWDNRCINGDAPASLKRFLEAIGFDRHRGLRSLGSSVVNIDYIGSTMQSHDSAQTAPH